MLVISRRIGEAFCIDSRIKVTVVTIKGNRVRIGIDAPDDVRVVREELSPWDELLSPHAEAPQCRGTAPCLALA